MYGIGFIVHILYLFQCLSCDTGLVQINLQLNWELCRINILDVLKPTEEEIVKWNQAQNSSPFEDSAEKSPRFTFKEDYDREENSNSKRNQKPSKEQ